MIIPISAFANQSMESLQKFIRRHYPLHIASFHQRPAQLFDGVLQRLSIFLLSKAGTSQDDIYTTSVIRWYTQARPALFETLHFSKIPQSQQHHILKVGTEIEGSIFRKFIRHDEIRKYLDVKSGKSNIVAYRTAGGGYWQTFLSTEFDTTSLSNKFAAFGKQYDARVLMAVLNSDLFWWYYFVSFDLFNLKDYMIFAFRFTYPSDPKLIRQLADLGECLQQELMSNQIRYLIRSKTRGDSYTVKFQNGKSKPTIEEIDRVLAGHYGFNDEEVDFIINYDIKYRMGPDADDEGGG